MSRTYRDRRGKPGFYFLCEIEEGYFPGCKVAWTWNGVPRSWVPVSLKEQAKRLAKYYADGHREFMEPGPSWWRNIFEERPLRRQSKRELQRYMQDSEYEPLIDAKQRKRVYWT